MDERWRRNVANGHKLREECLGFVLSGRDSTRIHCVRVCLQGHKEGLGDRGKWNAVSVESISWGWG